MNDTSTRAHDLPDKDNVLSICQFNFLPIRYMHPTWFSALPNGSLLQRLRHCQRTEQRLSRYILSHFNLIEQHWFDFTAPVNRIALLSGTSIIQLIFYAGLTLNATAIQRSLLRKDVIVLKQSLGEKPYLFALKRASFLYPSPAAKASLPLDNGLRIHLMREGIRCLSRVFQDQPRALTQRLLWKLPRSWAAVFLSQPVQGCTQKTLGLLLIKLVEELELA